MYHAGCQERAHSERPDYGVLIHVSCLMSGKKELIQDVLIWCPDSMPGGVPECERGPELRPLHPGCRLGLA